MRKSATLIAVVVLLALVLITTMANQQSAAQAPETSRRMLTWEYKTTRPDLTIEMQPDAKSELNELGKEGWELCESVRTEGLPFLTFKRQVNRRAGRAAAGL